MCQNPDYNPDRAQKLISLSMSRHLSTPCNISSKSMHTFLSNRANRQTDKRIAGKHIYIIKPEANFAVFCQNFAQNVLTNQKFFKFPGIPDHPDGLDCPNLTSTDFPSLFSTASHTVLIADTSCNYVTLSLSSCQRTQSHQSIIQPVTVVRDLGVLIDGELSMRQHVTRLAQTCFFIYAGCGLCVDNSGVMSWRDSSLRSCCRVWTIVTPYLPDSQTYICLLMMQKYVDILHVQTIIGSCRKQWIRFNIGQTYGC